MAGRKIVLKLEGPSGNGGHLELPVFVEEVGGFLGVLSGIVKETDEADVVFRVVHLSHASPFTMECVPMTKEGTPSVIAVDAVDRTLGCVAEGTAHHLSHTVLSAMERLVAFDPTNVAEAEIHIGGDHTERGRVYGLDDTFKKRLRLARHQENRNMNTIDGRLEQINIHNNTNTFRIYSSLPNVSPIKCVFPLPLLDEVQGALGAFVSVSGECLYRPEASFPYQINVREMERLPPDEELPNLRDIYGIAPDAAGNQSSEAFVRRLRTQWRESPQ